MFEINVVILEINEIVFLYLRCLKNNIYEKQLHFLRPRI